MIITAFIISYYSELSFMISAINDMYAIKTSDSSLTLLENRLNINFYNKLKLILNIRPNKKMKRMVSKGSKWMYFELDLMDIIK